MIYIAFLIVTTSVILIAFYHLQYFMMFSPTYYRDGELGDEYELLSIVTDDGVELEGVVYEPTTLYRKLPSIESTILFFAGRSQDSIGLINKLSLSFPHSRIITFNYRSYGKSGGTISEKNLFSDADKIASLVQKNYGDFYLLGFSLGSSLASHVASKHKTLGLFLVGAFDSVTLLAKEKYGICLSWVLRYEFDNISSVKQIDADTCMFVSRNDDTTYLKNSRNLKSHIKNLTFYIELDDISHKELLWDDKVINEIKKVIASG